MYFEKRVNKTMLFKTEQCSVGMCRTDFFISVKFLKSSDSVRNEFGEVRLKEHGSVRIFTTYVIDE